MWQCRLVRDGWRTVQTNNAYPLALMVDPVDPESLVACGGGQSGRQTRRIEIPTVQQTVLEVSEREQMGARAALAGVAARRQAAVLAAMTAKRG